jgi:hypothetical protein
MTGCWGPFHSRPPTMGHESIEITRRIYAGDWREVEEPNALVLQQLARLGSAGEQRAARECCPNAAVEGVRSRCLEDSICEISSAGGILFESGQVNGGRVGR